MSEWSYSEWAERLANENLKHRLATGDVLTAQANTLLSILLVAMGGALSYAARLADPGLATPMVWGAAGVSAWLALIAIWLMHHCIVTRSTEVLANEPDNCYKPDLALTADQVRGYEMEGIQTRINRTKIRNSNVASWLDVCRYAAIATPLVYALTAWAAGGRLG